VDRKRRIILTVLIAMVVIAILLYLSTWLILNFSYIQENIDNPMMQRAIINIIKRKIPQVIALVVVSILTASSSLVFQTITNNRILTPGILGFDAIYMVVHTFLLALLGTSIFVTNPYLNFLLVTILMVSISVLMYVAILRKNKNNIIFLLLFGMILSTFARSITNFVQVLMHPDDFTALLGRTSVSIVNINTSLVYVSLPLMVLVIILFARKHHTYDVMALGENYSTNLGVTYNRESMLGLIYISVAVAISTALVGPLSFLGLIAANIARELFKSSSHIKNMIYASLFAILFLVFGQVIIEIINYKTTVTTIVEVIGGLYLIYLIVKENRR